MQALKYQLLQGLFPQQPVLEMTKMGRLTTATIVALAERNTGSQLRRFCGASKSAQPTPQIIILTHHTVYIDLDHNWAFVALIIG